MSISPDFAIISEEELLLAKLEQTFLLERFAGALADEKIFGEKMKTLSLPLFLLEPPEPTQPVSLPEPRQTP